MILYSAAKKWPENLIGRVRRRTAIVTSDLRLRSLFSIVLYFTQILLPRVPADFLELKETESEAKEKPDKDIDNLY